MNIIVSGGTGFIGKALIQQLLDGGHAVVVLTRNPAKILTRHKNLTAELWDGVNAGRWAQHVDGADAVINLTGALIAGKRWTSRQKEIILNSRTNAALAVARAIGASAKKPSLFISVSGVGYYGNVPSGEVTESFPNGTDFLATVCREWEAAAQEAATYGMRVVTPRLGVVLGEGGGVLQRLVVPFKLYSGGYLGTGRQWLPWIHRDDLIRGLLFIINNPHMHGPINFTAPESVTMKTFCRIMGNVLRSPSWTFVPSFVLKMALGEMAEMLLTGQKAIPKAMTDAGFVFRYPSLEQALSSIYKK